jgi:hypothetical protein
MHGNLNTRPVKHISGRTLQRKLHSIPAHHRKLLALGLRAGSVTISHLSAKQAAAITKTR